MLQRMLDEHRNSVESIKKTAIDVIAQADEKEKEAVSGQVDNLVKRWEAINKACAAERAALEVAMVASKDYHDKMEPFFDWLESFEKKAAASNETLGIDADTIGKQIARQRVCLIF